MSGQDAAGGLPRCVTHHHACDCREAMLADRIAVLKRRAERWKEAAWVFRKQAIEWEDRARQDRSW